MLSLHRSLWHRALSLAMIMMLLSVNAVLAAGPDCPPWDPPRAPVPGEVLVNEFVAINGVIQTTEWVELFNTTSETLDISLMKIDDIAGGGGAPKQIPASTTIAAGGYYVMTFSSFLNNGGDDVRLLGTDGTTVHDSYTYTSATSDKSRCRKPDGGNWSAVDCDPTQGSSNSPALPPGTWTPGTLEIHVLNVGQGESQLIIGPTGKTLLIGVYEAGWNTNQAPLGWQARSAALPEANMWTTSCHLTGI